MNGRELTAHDVEFTFHRMLGLGDFSEAGPSTLGVANELLDVNIRSTGGEEDPEERRVGGGSRA